MSEGPIYDIIFAGGGTAACVTAGRLAAADPSLRILVLEAGPHIKDVEDHTKPSNYYLNLTRPGETFTFHVGKPSEALAGRSPIVPSGRCVGGGSGVNFVMYTRAAASDYDDWAFVYHNPGWGSKELIPLLKKAETYQPGSDNGTHGDSGPLKISYAREGDNVGLQFLDVAARYDPSRPTTNDVNGFHSCNAYGRWPRYVDSQSGRRSDTAHYYVYNQGNNPNLVIQDRVRVVRVITKDNIAVGVEYVDDKVGRSRGTPTTQVAHASRLVVVSAGTLGSPAILERSGIGSADVLKENDISQIVDLPGVGEHYMDHNLMFVPYAASDEAETLDVLFHGEQAEITPLRERWLQTGQGIVANNGIDAGIKLRPDANDLKEIGPDFAQHWRTYFENAPDKPVMFLGPAAAYVGVDPAMPQGKYYSMVYYTEYPVSTGFVHIKDGLNPYGPLDFHPGFLDNPADLGVLRWAYKRGRELARRMGFYRGEPKLAHPLFPEGSPAACQTSASGPVEATHPDIVYTPADNAAIDEYHRRVVETTWHSLGTCAMKPREQGGVVDPRLNVYGVRNLKVADCSIAPANVGSNTYNTAIAIGEKAAVIIAEDLKIPGVLPY